MQKLRIDNGNGSLSGAYPNTATIVKSGKPATYPIVIDTMRAVRKALARYARFLCLRTLDSPPPSNLVAYSARVNFRNYVQVHQRASIPLNFKEFLKDETKLENTTWSCAANLHPKNTIEELYRYL